MYYFTLVRERKSENQIWVNSFIVENEVKNPEETLRQIVKDYLATEDGKEAIKETCNDFNWGDVFTYIPDEFFEKYGMNRSWASDSMIVDQDEVLCK